MISVPGVGSGLDINSLISQLVSAEGDAKTFQLASKRATVETEISSFGSLKSALSSFKSSVSVLKDNATFSGNTLISSEEKVFTASSSVPVAASSYEIEAVEFAEAHKLLSVGFANSEIETGTGTLTISVGSASFSVVINSNNNTIAGVRDAINEATNNTGVTVTIANVDDGGGGTESKLIFSADNTGTDNSLKITVNDDDGNDTNNAGLSLFYYDTGDATTPEQLTETNAAVDAVIRIDGQTVTSASNTIVDAIQGVTINLLKKDPAVTHTLDIQLDKQKVKDSINSFVSNYNGFIGLLQNLTFFNQETGERGQLIGDRTVLTLNEQVRRELFNSVTTQNSSISTLVDLGITTGATGTLSVDSTKLNAAVDNNFDAVVDLFTSGNGIASRFDALLDDYVKADGIIDAKTDGLTNTIEQIDGDLEALNRSLGNLQERLLNQFSALDVLLGQLQSTSSFLTSQLAALSSFTNRSNS